jgi:hypothetical protein
MREILILNRFARVDLPAPVVDPLPYLYSLLHNVKVGVADVPGRGRVRGRAPTLPEEDHTGRKVVIPLDASVWLEYSRLLEFIKKNTQLQVFNGVPPPDSLENGKKLWLLLSSVEHRPTKTSTRFVLNIPLSSQCL